MDRKNSAQRPRIFCVGLNKTGTTSLARAFSLLGLRALHDAGRAKEALARAAARGLPPLTWIDDYDCYVDAPFYRWYRALDQHYPGSRFILNTRDDEAWVRSRIAHDRNWNTRRRPPGEPRRRCDRDSLLALKRRKEAEIMAHFSARPGDFMVIDVCAGQGWAELCAFLGRPLPLTPAGEAPAFPFENRRVS